MEECYSFISTVKASSINHRLSDLLANLYHQIIALPDPTCSTMPPKRPRSDYAAFQSSYRNKQAKQYIAQNAFGVFKTSTPNVTTHANYLYTFDTTTALNNSNTLVNSVLNPDSENEHNDLLDVPRKVAAIETTHNIHPTFVFENLPN